MRHGAYFVCDPGQEQKLAGPRSFIARLRNYLRKVRAVILLVALEEFGPLTTCYNRFVRWRRAGVWDRVLAAVTTAYDGNVQMIDSAPRCACISMPRTQKKPPGSLYGPLAPWADDQDSCLDRRSRSAARAGPDAESGERLPGCRASAWPFADKTYDADWPRRQIEAAGAAHLWLRHNESVCPSSFLPQMLFHKAQKVLLHQMVSIKVMTHQHICTEIRRTLICN